MMTSHELSVLPMMYKIKTCKNHLEVDMKLKRKSTVVLLKRFEISFQKIRLVSTALYLFFR